MRSHDPLAEAIQLGRVLARKYRLEHHLGAGGMGMVVAATHLGLGRMVALKFMQPGLLHDAEAMGRFLREARAAATLRSEHVAQVMDVDVDPQDGAPYIVMEHLEGEDLGALVSAGRLLGSPAVVDHLLQACEGLAEAHARGIIHRDLKPANLFVTRRPDGTPLVKVLDFGVSKLREAAASGSLALTGPRAVLGSPPYMAPEQMTGSPEMDTRADIWSLGVIMYELLAGSLPFRADTFVELALKVINEPHRPLLPLAPALPPALVGVVDRCLMKSPAQRFPDLAALALALAPHGGAEGCLSASRIARILDPDRRSRMERPTVTKAAAGAAPRAPSPPSRRVLVVGLGTAGLAVLIGLLRWRRPPATSPPVATPPVSLGRAVERSPTPAPYPPSPMSPPMSTQPIVAPRPTRAAATSGPGRRRGQRRSAARRTVRPAPAAPRPTARRRALAPPARREQYAMGSMGVEVEGTAWAAEEAEGSKGNEPASAAQRTLAELTARLDEAAREVVPWFLSQMPTTYFEDIDAASRLEHMAAICALRAAGQEPRLRMKSSDGRHITYVSPDAPGTLTTLMRDFREGTVRGAKLYSSKDRALIVDRFDIGESPPCDLEAPATRDKYLATIGLAESPAGDEIGTPPFVGQELQQHFAGLTAEYVQSCTPFRILTHAHLCRQVRQSGASAVMLENGDPERSRIVLACADVSSSNLLLRVANRLSTQGIDIVRAYVDTMSEAGEPVVIISAVVLVPGGGKGGEKIDPRSELWSRLRHDLLRLEWLDAETLELGYRVPALELGGADVLMTYADLAHRLLVKSNRYLYSRAHIAASLEQHLPLGEKLVALFLKRFDPRAPLEEGAYREQAAALSAEVAAKVQDDVAGTVLATMLEAVGATLRTNYFIDGRYALALRLDPTLIMRAAPRPEIPFGLFWVHGRGFNGFHLRFRDTARGGVRVVRPPSLEDHTRECERHLDEVYELAYAQELKNKDIPEGGAKAVILVHPQREVTPCVRAFVDGVLDFITPDPAARRQVVDRLGAEESIYFGPDENITPAHIDWIVGRARERRHPNPGALMSSKPGAGINHKEFGVTSEGVNVFLEVALVEGLGIDPRRQSFTLKLTGGPDGDVGGNEIKIALREFGERVKIVGVADGQGCAEDPRGLDHAELLRLVDQSRSIAFFDTRRLSSEGRVTTLAHPDGARIRNEMHNRVVSDVFIPAGGRPQTINESNWARFLGPEGRPASRLIVEGANLFITQEARRKLFEQGVVIIKDSSANKCGVICSSYEVIACLLLEEAEFLAIKPAFVAQVLDRLRLVARREANLLFQAHRHRPAVPHFELSILLSREINRLGAALATHYPALERDHPALVRATVLAYLPPVLVDRAGERVFTRLPPSYRAQLVSTSIAADLVYSEGLDYFGELPEVSLTELCLAYVLRQQQTQDLVREVASSSLPHAAEIANLLRVGGTRAALQVSRRGPSLL